MFNQSKSFKKLNKEWSKILKKDGFEDIEQEDGNLTSWAGSEFTRKRASSNQIIWAANQDYYRLAESFAREYKFYNFRDKFIWKEHSKGLTSTEIEKSLRTTKFAHLKDRHIREIVQKYAKIMLAQMKQRMDDEYNEQN